MNLTDSVMNVAECEDAIMSALSGYRVRGMMTYHIANVVFPRSKKDRTTVVRKCCERLEKAGRIQRIRSNYVAQICWAITGAGHD